MTRTACLHMSRNCSAFHGVQHLERHFNRADEFQNPGEFADTPNKSASARRTQSSKVAPSSSWKVKADASGVVQMAKSDASLTKLASHEIEEI